jgi:ABC-type bacteriocin/lantibiotic exporter with double-glycine peptidase domain
MSWSLFLIAPKNVSTKIAVATSAMLTPIAYRFVVDSQVPRVPYLTRLDIFIFADTLLVLSSLFMVTLTAYLINVDKERLAIRIEQVWRLLFLGVFGIILLKTLFL